MHAAAEVGDVAAVANVEAFTTEFMDAVSQIGGGGEGERERERGREKAYCKSCDDSTKTTHQLEMSRSQMPSTHIEMIH